MQPMLISSERMNVDDLKKLARIVDFPYEEALRTDKPKAYIKNKHIDIKAELNKVADLQAEISLSLIKIYKELNTGV